MPQPNFRVVDPERDHPRDIAPVVEVKRFRLDRERERLPICNQVCTGAPALFVDDIIQRTQREMPEEVRRRYKPNPYVITAIVLASIFFAIKFLFL